MQESIIFDKINLMIIWKIPIGSTLCDSMGREFVLTQAAALPRTLSRFRDGTIFCSVQIDGLSSSDEPYSSVYGEQYYWKVLTVGDGNKPLRIVNDDDYDYIINWMYKKSCECINKSRGFHQC